MRRKNRLARLGMLSLALLVALALTGVGYSAWLDTIEIKIDVEMGSWGVGLNDLLPTTDNTTLALIPPDTLELSLSNASAGTTYSGLYSVNSTGTVPIKIQNIWIVDPPGTNASVSGVAVGSVIDVGSGLPAGIDVLVTADGDYVIQVTFGVVTWNN